MSETRPGDALCSACSDPGLEEKMAAHVRPLKPAAGRCPTCGGARLALKELNIDDDDNKEMPAGSKKTTKNPRPDESEDKPAAANKRRKKVMVRLSKECIEYMQNHPPPPPSPPVKIYHWGVRDLEDAYLARERAQREEHDRILKQFEDHGYAYKQVEVTDDEEDKN